ncbi:MAG TPA: M28 family peptidase [Roseivirga sp.]
MQRYSNFIFLTLVLFLTSVPALAQLDRLDSGYMLEDLRKLSHDAAEGRKTGTKGAEAARKYIIKQLEDIGSKSFQNNFRHPFTFNTAQGDTIQGENIVAYIEGEIDSAFIITAHYDHLGKWEDEVYNGADDNASGVAALLALLEYFENFPPKHTLIFAALDAEEMGLQGANAIVKDPSIPQHLLKLNINMDMISVNNKNELFIAGTSHYPYLKNILEPVNPFPLQLKFGHDTEAFGINDWTNASDHAVFHRKGIPFIYFGVEDHANYHKPTDTFENINKEFYTMAVHAILDCILALDQALK